ncbi:MAG: GvpL/GvpF family gas vesicle protein [Dehalococcoidales bacterium]|jgi:ribosomal protein L12E/L44/L45/RPP1/RPP2
MEEIFYAVLALRTAGKPVNKATIQAVLNQAGKQVDETALDAMAAFVESLANASEGKEGAMDPRIIKFLTSELTGHKVETTQLEALLAKLSTAAASVPETLNGHLDTAPEAQAGAADVESESRIHSKGRYVYGVAMGDKEVRLGPIGIGGSEVYTIPYKDIRAIVHNCSTEPYQSTDGATVKDWVNIHEGVLEAAGERLGIVVPLGFDTILQSKDGSTSPENVVNDWLKEDYDRLREVMRKIEGKAEYGVQVSYKLSLVIEQISEKSEEIRRIKEEIATKSPGVAYMYKQKLERAVKAETEQLANAWFTDFYTRIKPHTEDIIVEKTKKLNDGKTMLLNLSCLVARDKVDSLGKELEAINNMNGFSVHFSGPWPPYSFVAKPVVLVKGE